jgi:hypothetical protein
MLQLLYQREAGRHCLPGRSFRYWLVAQQLCQPALIQPEIDETTLECRKACLYRKVLIQVLAGKKIGSDTGQPQGRSVNDPPAKPAQ